MNSSEIVHVPPCTIDGVAIHDDVMLQNCRIAQTLILFVNLSQDIAENFKCSVCLDIFEAPLELPCGHIYCYECIRTYFSSSSTSECPECRGRVRARDVKPPNRKLLCLLHNLNIKCEFAGFGCSAVMKVESLIAHTRECRYNRSTRPTAPPQAPPSEDLQQNIENVLYLLGDDSNLIDRSERVQRLQRLLQAFALAMEQNEADGSVASHNDEEISDDDEFLIRGRTLHEQRMRLLSDCFAFLIFVVLSVIVASLPLAAIIISALTFNSCTAIPTLPHGLMALGVSMFLSIVLGITRSCWYRDNICVGLKIIQAFAFGSFIYLAVVVCTNLDHASKVPNHNSTLTCDSLLFEFSFWFVTTLFALISIAGIIWVMYLIFNNLRAIWSQWNGSYLKLALIYTIAIVGMIVSVSAVSMGSIYFDSCAAIPNLTTNLVVFGCIGLVCWLTMLLSRHFMNCCVYVFVIGWLVSFICIAIDVHQHFPWQFTSHALHYTINCNKTIYVYSLVTVCVNYIIVGATALMFSIYAGICTCLFFS
ncbi:hypothetical protein HA402_004053 [Bradysia odoriphaga]|nr:hypothetical protein HA402_004053 [Bradysia odoriphaga]